MDIQRNGIYQSDCLALLERIESETVTLAYIDPPVFTPRTGILTQHTIHIDKFGETELVTEHLTLIKKVLHQIHRVLKANGNLFFYSEYYLEADYKKILADVFGRKNSRLDIILPKFRTSRSLSSGPRMEHHTIFYYSKGNQPIYNKQFKQVDRQLNIFQSEEKSVEVGSIWDDILPIPSNSNENTNYQDQQPLLLMNRIIKMGSNQDDLILDPFCGSGTTFISANNNRRRWMGCDLSTKTYSLAIRRIEELCKLKAEVDFNTGDQYLLEQELSVVVGNKNEIVDAFDKQLQISKFILNQPISIEETRHNEFKEIEALAKTVERIKERVDEYAVAFLNSEGGQILWGIRDRDRTVTGVKLNSKQRDEVRRVVHEKLQTIQPPIALTAFRVEIHKIYQEGSEIEDQFVVQIVIPAVSNRSLYFTSSGKCYVRVDGANKELKGLNLQAEILNRSAHQQ